MNRKYLFLDPELKIKFRLLQSQLNEPIEEKRTLLNGI